MNGRSYFVHWQTNRKLCVRHDKFSGRISVISTSLFEVNLYIPVHINDRLWFLSLRPRRKSGTGILFVDEENPSKSRYNLEECNINHQYNSDIEMLTMLSVNQDNGKESSESCGTAELNLTSPCLLSAGPHREMAVDVPESFIARNKTPPRYPPRPVQVVIPLIDPYRDPYINYTHVCY